MVSPQNGDTRGKPPPVPDPPSDATGFSVDTNPHVVLVAENGKYASERSPCMYISLYLYFSVPMLFSYVRIQFDFKDHTII